MTGERGSLPMAMLAVLLGAMLGALILPMVLTQDRATSFDVSRVRSLHAAQTGVEVVVGRIRASAATDASTGSSGRIGNSARLPCYGGSSSAPALTGSANGTGRAEYSVTVDYYEAPPGDGGRPVPCSGGSGTYGAVMPRYAVITSTSGDESGDGGSRGRRVVSTYVFATDDTSIPGGQIRLHPRRGSTDKWCLAVQGERPSTGTSLVIRPCSSSAPPMAQQVFAYRMDLSIQLVSSVATTHPSGLCLGSGPVSPGRSAVRLSDVEVVLVTCGTSDPTRCPEATGCGTPSGQQWRIDDDGHLRGTVGDGPMAGQGCISAADSARVTLQACDGLAESLTQTWVPAPTTGTGAAGGTADQLVNYREFGSCVAATERNRDTASLILRDCRQTPDIVVGAQTFIPVPALRRGSDDALRLLQAGADGSPAYCLTSPLTVGAVRLTPCPVGALEGSAYSWAMTGDRRSDDELVPLARRFTIVDTRGRCLGAGPVDDLYQDRYLRVTVAPCDGSTGQKWNADPDLGSARLINIHEEPVR